MSSLQTGPCPRIEDLPAPPPGRVGWPWTEETPRPTATEGWPRITVVTPSFNQAQFVEETIRSVLLQSYPNLEYLVIDGGSTDGSVDIIRRYSPWLAYWVSEPDRGQANALNKGFRRSSGRVMAWLNSDDMYLPEALCRAGAEWAAHPGSILAGPVVYHEVERRSRRCLAPEHVELSRLIRFWMPYMWHQPGTFFPRDEFFAVGGLDDELRYVMDYDLMCRLVARREVIYLDAPIAEFRIHRSSKTFQEAEAGFYLELARVSQRYWSLLSPRDRKGCERGVTFRLVRKAARQIALRRPAKGWPLIKAAWAISPAQTLRNAAAHVARLGRLGPYDYD